MAGVWGLGFRIPRGVSREVEAFSGSQGSKGERKARSTAKAHPFCGV